MRSKKRLREQRIAVKEKTKKRSSNCPRSLHNYIYIRHDGITKKNELILKNEFHKQHTAKICLKGEVHIECDNVSFVHIAGNT